MTNNSHWLLGVDGGGTSCRVRLCDAQGKCIGQGTAGSANVRLGAATVFKAIEQATGQALREAGLSNSILKHTYAALGLAGAVSEQLNRSITDYPHPFAKLCVDSDASIACLGAHQGQDGAILILGTGSCAMIKTGQHWQVLGGWGLAISDHGSGARLGLEFVRTALGAFEGLSDASPLTVAFMQEHDNSPAQLLKWADSAKPADFGSLVPMIIQHYQHSDPVALQLIDNSVQEVIQLLNRTVSLGAKKISLMGGYANFIGPLASRIFANSRPTEKTKPIIVPAQGDALDGAIILATHLSKVK